MVSPLRGSTNQRIPTANPRQSHARGKEGLQPAIKFSSKQEILKVEFFNVKEQIREKGGRILSPCTMDLGTPGEQCASPLALSSPFLRLEQGAVP